MTTRVSERLTRFRRTSAEVAAGVVPVNTYYPSHDVCGEVLLARYGAVCDGVTDDISAWNRARDVAERVGIQGASSGRDQGTYIAFGGKSAHSSPIVLPRSGNSRSYFVGIRGFSHESSGLYPTTAITGDAGVIQWDTVTSRLFGCRLANFHIFLANAAQRAVHFALNDPGTTVFNGQQWGQEEIKELDIDLLIYASNQYHQQLVRLEGKAKYGRIRLHVDCAPGSVPTYTTLALWADSDCITTAGADGTKADAIVDNAGVEYAKLDINCVNSRGGNAAIMRGRLHNCDVKRMNAATGSLDGTSCIYLRDSSANEFGPIETEGRQETYQVYLENCYYNLFKSCNIGTPDSPGPATALRLVNSCDNEFHNKPSASGKPAYSTFGGLLISGDATSDRNRFYGFAGTGAYASEISLAGVQNYVDYRRETSGSEKRTVTVDDTTIMVGPWTQENVAAAQTDVEMVATARWIAPRAGSLISLAVKSTGVITTSTCTIKAFKNAAASVYGGVGSEVSSSFRVQLNNVDTIHKETRVQPGLYTFAAGDEIYLTVSTGGTFAPTTADIRAWLEVQLDRP